MGNRLKITQGVHLGTGAVICQEMLLRFADTTSKWAVEKILSFAA